MGRALQLQLLACIGTVTARLNCDALDGCSVCAAKDSCEWTSCQGAVPSCTTKGRRPASGCAVVHCGSSGCDKHHFLNATNVIGSDLSNSRTGQDPAACCEKCRTTSGCHGWTLLTDYDGGRCYLKSASSPVEPKLAAISGAENDTPANWTVGCGAKPQSGMPFCNSRLPLHDRVADLMGRMRPMEKMAMLRAQNPAIPRVGLGQYDWDTEVLHGIFSNHGNFPPDVVPSPTLFPNGVGLAATFDTALIEQIGSTIATEQRALNNMVRAVARAPVESGQYQGVNGYAPNCNLYRDPRWGRAQETFGESPMHNGAMCAAFIRGLQGNHSTYIKIAATVKHYAFYSGPECDHGCTEFPGVDRLDFNAVVDKQDAVQSYLPMFAAAVGPVSKGGGGSASVMNSFSHVNGLAMPANKYYLDTVLRKQFGLGEGLIVTDWGSIGQYERNDSLVPHQPSCNGSKACVAKRAADCLKAGTDMDLRGGYQVLPDSLSMGFITEADIDRSLNRTLSLAFKLGRFDQDGVPYHSIPFSAIGSPKHRALARKAALDSLVLLRNKLPPPSGMDDSLSQGQPLLPLDASKVDGIAVVGPNAEATDACNPYSGDYCICNNCPANHTVSIFRGLRDYLARKNPTVLVKYSKGSGLTGKSSQQDLSATEALIRSQAISHVVLAVGLSGQLEGEGSDRVPSHGLGPGIGLPEVQQELVNLVASVGKPVILVVVAGGAVPVPQNVNITAEFAALYPGLETGNALASVIFGEQSPAGRLPFSIPHNVSQLGYYLNFSMQVEPFGRTFVWLRGEGSQQLHEYGFGLSFTQFAYSKLVASTSRLIPTTTTASTDAGQILTLRVTVTNAGTAQSDEVVQVYSNWTVANTPMLRVPVRQLVGFVRLHAMAPKEHRVVEIPIKPKDYSLVNMEGERVLPSGHLTFSVGGSQPTAYSIAAGAARGESCTLRVLD